MTWFWKRLALSLALVAGVASHALARSHVALVIDNAGEQQVASEKSTAVRIADQLGRMNYAVTYASSTDPASLRRLVADFGSASREAEVALFYFHGSALSDGGRNMLLANAAAPSASLDALAVTLADLQRTMAASKANIIILDPKVQDALAASMVSQGAARSLRLASFEPAPRFLVATANVSGPTLAKSGSNIFADTLLSQLSNADTNWSSVAGKLRWETFQRSRGAMVPMVASRLQAPVRIASLGDAPIPAPPVAGTLDAAQRRELIAQIQRELQNRQCHSEAIDGDADSTARSLAELKRNRDDTPGLEVASATADQYEEWLGWLRSTRGRLCAPAPEIVPPVRNPRPRISKPEPEATPEIERRRPSRRATRPEREPTRRVSRPAPRREAPVVRRQGNSGRSFSVPTF